MANAAQALLACAAFAAFYASELNPLTLVHDSTK
jgi:hypothetical protein